MSGWKPSKDGAKIADAESVKGLIAALQQVRGMVKSQIDADTQTIEELRAKLLAMKSGGVS